MTVKQMSPSATLKEIARKHAKNIIFGEVSPAAGARAIWTDVFYQLEEGDHSVDQFVYWADALDEADNEQQLVKCQVAIIKLAREFLEANA